MSQHHFDPKAEVQVIPLEVISVLWTPSRSVSPRDKQDAREEKTARPAFASAEVARFYETYIERHLRDGRYLQVIVELLQVLDDGGDCPLAERAEQESGHPAGVTLREHALNVAQEAFELLNAGRAVVRNNTADALIAALGHDIGRAPGLVDAADKLASPGLASVVFLEPMLDGIRTKTAILDAIRFLHAAEKEKKRAKDIALLRVLEQAHDRAGQAEQKKQMLLFPQRKESKTSHRRSGREQEAPDGQRKNRENRDMAEALLGAMKPLLARDARESFVFEDQVFVAPDFVRAVAADLTGEGGDENPLQSLTDEEVARLLGSAGRVPAFRIRFRYRKARSCQPVQGRYVVLDKGVFGDPAALETRAQALGIRKVICVSEESV